MARVRSVQGVAAIAWITVENAITAWLVAATGLAAGQVIFQMPAEGAPRPERPYITVLINDIDQVGQDWRVTDAAPDAEEGAEIRVRSRGHRTGQIQLRCFGADGTGTDAAKILVDAIAYLPVAAYDLDLAGVGIADTEGVQAIAGRRGGILEPQATAAVNIHLGSEVEARLPEVARFETKITEESIGQVGDVWIPDPPLPES